mmetsp:Transcript_89788/g.290580  ORF Transcript_89788/g.290580 Transcript_89788/m.290580 type:complete len:87 (-) Transcript_89788:178-438(-)
MRCIQAQLEVFIPLVGRFLFAAPNTSALEMVMSNFECWSRPAAVAASENVAGRTTKAMWHPLGCRPNRGLFSCISSAGSMVSTEAC